MHERREMITTTETQDLKRIFMGMFENEAPSIHDIYVPTAKALSNDSQDGNPLQNTNTLMLSFSSVSKLSS